MANVDAAEVLAVLDQPERRPSHKAVGQAHPVGQVAEVLHERVERRVLEPCGLVASTLGDQLGGGLPIAGFVATIGGDEAGHTAATSRRRARSSGPDGGSSSWRTIAVTDPRL